LMFALEGLMLARLAATEARPQCGWPVNKRQGECSCSTCNGPRSSMPR
jgi:hypothetical protein